MKEVINMKKPKKIITRHKNLKGVFYMKNLKKFTAGILAIILLIVFFTGCSGAVGKTSITDTETTETETTEARSNFNLIGFPIVNEKITLSAMQLLQSGSTVDFDNLPFYTELEEKTNIHIKWEVVGQADWNQKLNLMFASGDYTDMILRGDVDCDEYGANKGILISLNDYFETYMPNYSALLKYDNITEAMPSTDGKIYYTGYMMGAGAISSGHYFINRTWLDALDLDVPTTIDELTDVFRAFKTKDPNGNGENDEIPYESMMLQTVRGLNYCFSFWGIPENTLFVFVDDNNKVQFTPYQKGYRECIEWLNTLYREGLIDPECISQDNTVYTAKLNTEKCGFFTNWRLTKNGYEVLEDDFECMLPVSAEGYTPVMPRVLELGGFGAALTSTNKHIKESLRWLDAQYETETMFRERFGVLDEHFKLNADGKYEVIVTPENLKQLVPSNEGQFFAPPTWYRNHYVFASHHEEKAKYCDWYEPYLEKTSYNYLTSLSKMTTDEKDTLTKVQTELSKFIEEKLTAFITHGVTDDQWNNFIKTLGDLKAEEYVNLYQNALNKYLGI